MPMRAVTLAGSFVAGLVWMGLLTWQLPAAAAEVLLDRNTQGFLPYPFTIQNVMWIVFFVGAGELFVRHQVGSLEEDRGRPAPAEAASRRREDGPAP